jgi:PTH1 family peptidyl-tRNA hydrolase
VKLIVGLGNPGKRYEGTRHNLGFAVVDLLAQRWRIGMSREKFHAWFGDGLWREQRVALLKPMTFMNNSGQAVWAAVRFHDARPEDLLVILDDAAMPLGQLRMRARGSGGGHNGLQDVIDRVGSSEFPRLRLGIDAPYGVSAGYVLSRFSEDEKPVADEMIQTAADAVECWFENGPVTTMNRFNQRVDSE